jgi:hypothetical protein
MHFSEAVAAVAMFLSYGVEAAPVSPNLAAPAVLFMTSNSVNDCGNSSLINQSSGGSPKISDCLQIAANIVGGGTWTVEAVFNLPHQLVQFGTCAFGVQAKDVTGAWFKVGNQDIIDLIHSSVDRFSWNGLVGAKGTMPCQAGNGDGTVDWGLYHT